MLEPPALPSEKITACVQHHYGLMAQALTFLPLGLDPHTAVYRLETRHAVYFLKLRQGTFMPIALALPHFLSTQGLGAILSPLATQTGQLWAELTGYQIALYPFIAGQDAYQVSLTASQWATFGATLQHLHTQPLPPALYAQLPQETYAAEWRLKVRDFLAHLAQATFVDAAAADLAAFLLTKQAELLALIARTEQLATTLQAQPPACGVCHTDLHPGNLWLAENGTLYIVDWDAPLLAPKERDLMFIGGGLGFVGHTPATETALFYQGYGSTPLNQLALAYYRYERIIQDIAAFCEQIFLTAAGGADRAQAVRYVRSNFLPDGPLALAYLADPARPNPH